MAGGVRFLGRAVKFLCKSVCLLVVGIVGTVLFILTALNFLLQTGFFTNFVLDQALPPVERLTCSKIEVDKLRLSLYPFSLLIEGARYTDAEEKYSYPFATVKRLYVHVRPAPLLVGQVVVDEVTVEGAENYLFLRDGLENLPICPKPDEPEEPFEPFKVKLPIVVEKVSVDAKFRMDMPSVVPEPTEDEPNPAPTQPLALRVDSIKLGAHGNLNRGDVAADLHIGGVDASFGEMRDQIQTLDLAVEGNLQTWVAKLKQLAIEMPDLRLNVTGDAKDILTGLDVSTDVRLEVDVRKVNQLVLRQPQDLQFAGLLTLAANGKLKLAPEQLIWAAQGSIGVPEAQVNRLPLREVRVDFIASPERAHLTTFHAQVGGGTIDLNGKLDLKNEMTFDADVATNSLDVGQILAHLGQSQLGVAGRVGTDLHAAGQLKPLLVDAKGRVSVAGAQYQKLARVDSLSLQLDATLDKSAANGTLRYNARTNIDLQDLVYTQRVTTNAEGLAIPAQFRDLVEVGRGTIALDANGTVPPKNGPPMNAVAVGDIVLEELRYADQTQIASANLALDARATVGAAIAYQAKIDLLASEVRQGDKISAQKVELLLDAGGSPDANEVRQLKLAVDGVHVDQADFSRIGLNAAGLFGAKRNQVREFTLTTDHTKLVIGGGVDLQGDGPLDLTVDLEAADLAEFAALVGKPLAGHGKLNLRASGTAAEPRVNGQLDFGELRFDVYNVNAIRAGVGFDGAKVIIDDLVIEREGARITFDGSYDLNESTVQALLDLPETEMRELLALAGMQDQVKASGKLGLHADISGPVVALNGSVVLSGKEIEAYGERVKSLALNARLADGEVLLDDLTLTKERGIRPLVSRGVWKPRPTAMITDADQQPTVIQLSGALNPNDSTFALKLRTNRLNEMASDTVARQRLHVMADLDLVADVEGSFDNPAGAFELRIDRGRYEHFDLGRSTIKAIFADQQIQVTGALLADRRPWAPDDEVAPRVAAAGADPDFADDGAFQVAQTSGNPPAPDAGYGSIRLDATLKLTEARPFEARVRFDRFDYSNFLKSAEQVREQQQRAAGTRRRRATNGGEEYKGLIDGEIAVDGRFGAAVEGQQPEAGAEPAFNATIRFDQLSFQRGSFVLRNQNEDGQVRPIMITYRDGRVDVQDFALGGTGMRIKIDRQDLNNEPYFVLTGQVALETAKAFTNSIATATGMLRLDAAVPVRFDLGKVTASAKIDQATIDLADMPTSIENLKMDVQFANRVATVRQLNADIGGGTLKIGGSYRLPTPVAQNTDDSATPPAAGESAPNEAAHAQLELFVKVDNVKTRYDPYLELVVRKVDLLITTRADGKLDVSGEVDIEKAVVRYNIDIVQILQSFQKSGGGAAGSQVYEKKEESVYFNIVIRAPRGVAVDNNFIQIEMAVDLVLTGDNISPGMIGTVQVTKGQATVLQNTYKVSSAVIQFFDDTRIYPAFDINAETTVNEIDIFINVSGTPDRYQITFQSDPPMTERDIVTLLSLGVSYEQFQAGSGDETAALAAAAQQLIGSQFRQYTGIDFGVDTSTGVSRLRVSREFEREFMVSLFRGIADPTLSAEAEWRFMRYLAVYVDWSNFAGQEAVPSYGGFGTGIRLKIDFR